MEFFAVNGKRPVRLSKQTRLFAYESLNHKYGLDTIRLRNLTMDHVENFQQLTTLQQYDLSIRHIAENAPLRICDGEKVSGAATLGLSVEHTVPVMYHENVLFGGVSHLTIDFAFVLKNGIDGIQAQVEASLEKHRGTDKEAFLISCQSSIASMRVWHQRYLDALRDLPGFEANYQNLQNVPFRPAANFYEAVQSMWFTFAFVRLCGGWPGFGRIDWLLGDYLEKDLAQGILTMDEAREILAHFFIKGCEWITGLQNGSGDAQHYQNILLAGIDADGKEVTNTVTYLVLDIIEELGISDFPTSVRINRNTDEKLLKRISEVIRLGGGVIAVYNEDLVIESMTDAGYPLSEARSFTNDGCWEVQVPGRTFFLYYAIDGLKVLQQSTLDSYSGNITFSDFESLYHTFIQDLKKKSEETVDCIHSERFSSTEGPMENWVWASDPPCSVISLFEHGCIEKGRSYVDGGPIYNIFSLHVGGFPDIANSLYAIKKLVFEEQKVTFPELMQILKNDWQGHEALRLYALNQLTYFGNDNDEVDLIAKRLVDDFADICDGTTSPFKTPAGISTFGRQVEWSPLRLATPYGKTNCSVLAGNFSPTPGTDREGATAIIRSYCKSDLKRPVTGSALDIKLLPSAVNGENGLEAIASLIRGFVTLGGFFMQLDIADTELLKQAQEHPEDYQNLSVRVSGWNARFVTLNKAWQDMIIAQTGSDL